MNSVQIKTKFKQNDKVRIKQTIFGDNGWATAFKDEIMYVFGFTNVPIGRELKTIYLLLSQNFYENRLAKELPDNSDIVLVQDNEIELVE